MNKTDLKESKERFLKEMEELTGFSRPRLKDILRTYGHHYFDIEKLGEYRACILAAHHKYTEIKDRFIKPLNIESSCHIPGCKGYKVMQRANGFLPSWYCSEGGPRHAIAWEVAKLKVKCTGVPEEEALEKTHEYSKEIVEYLNGKEKEKAKEEESRV